MAEENDQPSISDREVQRVMICLDGFSLTPQKQAHFRTIRGLLRYNDFASSAFHKDDNSVNEYIFRFKRNVCFFFRTLEFFKEFYHCRGFRQSAGFWGIIQQEAGTLFEKCEDPVNLLRLLISSRDAWINEHPGSAIESGSLSTKYIQRLVRHWSSVMSKFEGAIMTKLTAQDTKRLTGRRAEWRTILTNGDLADNTYMDDFLEGQNLETRASHPLKRALVTISHEPGGGVKSVQVKAEPSDEINGSITLAPIGEAKKRKARSSDLHFSQADEQDAARRNKRSRAVSPEPKKPQTTPRPGTDTPSPNRSPGSDRRLARLDRRLSDAPSLQLQHGVDITSPNPRLQSQSSQLSDMAATATRLSDMSTDIKDLQKTASSNKSKLSALSKKVEALGQEERVIEIDRQQLKKIAVEALHTDLRGQLDSQLNDLVQAAVSRIPIQDLVKNARDQVIDRQRDTIRRLSEKVQNLERELSHPGQPPLYQPPHRRRPPADQRGDKGLGTRGSWGFGSLGGRGAEESRRGL